MTFLRNSPSGRRFDLSVGEQSAGLQTAWAIDPSTGDDEGPGTPSAPLRTMDELNSRLEGVTLRVAATLALIGNVTDAPLWLNATRFASGASLTVSGTRTDLASGTIVAVTGLGPTGTMPWQVTTSGITWSASNTPVGSQVRLSTGQVAMISEIIGANDVLLGAIAAPGVSVVSSTPAPGATLTVASLSRALPPIVSASAQTTNATTTFSLSFQNLSFDPSSNIYWLEGGCPIQFYGCEMRFAASTFYANTPLNLRACRFTLTGNLNVRTGFDFVNTYGLVVAGTGSTLFNHQLGTLTHSNLNLNGARLSVTNAVAQVSATHIRNTAGPVLIQNSGRLQATGIINGSTGNTSIAIDIPLGTLSYQGAANKPTITAGSDPRVGGVTRTLAQIPFVALQLDAVPPTVTTLTGNGASFVQEG